MHRALSLCLFVTACSTSSASKLDEKPMPRNFICERFAVVNPSAKCAPELSDAGEAHTHTARVTIDKDTVACALNAGQVSMVCTGLVYVAPKAEPAPEPKGKR